jgi:hypothetical protein
MKLKDITEWPKRWSIPSGKATQMQPFANAICYASFDLLV